MHVFIDFETRSPADLRRVGSWAYAEHPQTVATHLAYALDDGPVSVWEPGQPFPPELRKLAAERCIFVAHNMQFDRRIWNLCLTRYVAKLPRLDVDRVACSAAAARILGLPGALDALAAALNIGVSKDLEGRRLMLRYAAKPDATPTPDEAARIREYAATDIRVLQRVWSLLPRMTPQERDVWVLDQIVNDRGIPINTREVRAFHAAARESQRLLNARIAELTGGYVRAVTEASKLLEWVRGRGYDVDSVSDFALRGLDTSGDPVMQEVVCIRTDGAKASVRKFAAMLECVSVSYTHLRAHET
jgi:DNA polymerase